MIFFDITKWYWVIGSNTTTVFSSASMTYVPVTDTAYVAFLRQYRPSRIDTVQELGGALIAMWVPLLDRDGVTITSTATPALNGQYAIDDAAQANITALSTGVASGKPLPGHGATFNYPDMAGTMHAFSGANFLNFASAIEDYMYMTQQAVVAHLGGDTTPMPSSALTIA